MKATEPLLEIRNFLGIQDAAIPIKPITLLIGPQASGKSVIAKLLYYFTEFTNHVLSGIQKGSKKRELNQTCREVFISYFAPSSRADDNFKLKLTVSGEYIEISRKSAKGPPVITVSHSPWFMAEMQRTSRLLKKVATKNKQEETNPFVADEMTRRQFWEDILEHFDNQWPQTQIFVPAGRSFFANLQNNIFSFLSSNNAIDPFLSIFGKYFEGLKRNERYPFKESPLTKSIDAKIRNIICGDYVHEKGKDFVRIRDGRKINLSNASSGQQESVPLALTIRGIARRSAMNPYLRALYIEEPEAHLFPVSQKNIVELLGILFNVSQRATRLVVTTHSPYVLTAFNNLLYAGQIRADADAATINKLNNIVPENARVAPDELGAFMVAEGSVSSIINPDDGLIEAHVIDSVSTDIAVQFEDLSALASK